MKESTIRRLIQIVEESEIETFEITRFFRKIKITKRLNNHNHNGSGDSSAIVVGPGTAERASSQTREEKPKTEPKAEPAATEEAPNNYVEIISPMVGTFYRSPAPDADPFVDIGDRVKPGETVCIVEAMKLMNEIEAEVAGVIKEIKIENAQPVEYGQVLFVIDPDG